MFLQVSVILFTGGCLVWGVSALGGAWSEGAWPRGGAWSGGCLLWGVPGPRGVPGGDPPDGYSRGVFGPRGCLLDPPDGYCCGRYASYWNAFLLKINVHNFGCTTFSLFLSTLRPFCCLWPRCETNKDPTNRS